MKIKVYATINKEGEVKLSTEPSKEAQACELELPLWLMEKASTQIEFEYQLNEARQINSWSPKEDQLSETELHDAVAFAIENEGYEPAGTDLLYDVVTRRIKAKQKKKSCQ